MPRLSLWKTQQSNDYTFFDKNIKEQFTVGGTDLYIHKYIGTNNPAGSTDATLPHYDETKPTNIQDLLFLENRDRKYDANIYRLRGHYSVQNLDFDLSQFGLFLTNDIIFVTVHYNQMLEIIGRKLMVGDVFELPHLEDYHPLNTDIPVGLRRYYQITDANYASEGFSPTWWPHLWRIKCEPLTNTQEFQDIMNQPINKDNYIGDWEPGKTYQPGYTVTFGGKIYTPLKPVPEGIDPTNTEYWGPSSEKNLVDIVSTYNQNISINEAVIAEAKRIVPLSGYDNSDLYIVPTFINNEPAPPIDIVVPEGSPVNTIGRVSIIGNPDYKFASAVVKLLPGNNVINNPFSIVQFQSVVVEPQLTEVGSGKVFATPALSVSVVDADGTITGPYGTADNTYATADMYLNFTLVAVGAGPNVNRIFVDGTLTNDVSTGLLLKATVYSENGTPNQIFPTGTRIIAVDRETNSIVVDNYSLGSMPAGTLIYVNYDFDKPITLEMDYRADCDPAFQFIKRASPRSFGYVNGYMTGDHQAPNGEPLVAGTQFPSNARVGDYFLRIDYLPQQLYRFDGFLWVHISSNVRTDTGFTDEDQSQLSRFINDRERTPVSSGGTIPTRQSLSNALRIKPDA